MIGMEGKKDLTHNDKGERTVQDFLALYDSKVLETLD